MKFFRFLMPLMLFGVAHAAAPDPATVRIKTATVGRAPGLQLQATVFGPSGEDEYASEVFCPGQNNEVFIPFTEEGTYTVELQVVFAAGPTEWLTGCGCVENGEDNITFEFPLGPDVDVNDKLVSDFDIPPAP